MLNPIFETKPSISTMKTRPYYFSAAVIFCLGLISIFILPYLFTNFSIHGYSMSEKTAWIGDSIGGMTAPIIGIISASLVFVSFMAQVNANVFVQRQFQQQQEEFNYQKEMDKSITAMSYMDYAESKLNNWKWENEEPGKKSLQSFSSQVKGYLSRNHDPNKPSGTHSAIRSMLNNATDIRMFFSMLHSASLFLNTCDDKSPHWIFLSNRFTEILDQLPDEVYDANDLCRKLLGYELFDGYLKLLSWGSPTTQAKVRGRETFI